MGSKVKENGHGLYVIRKTIALHSWIYTSFSKGQQSDSVEVLAAKPKDLS